MFELINVGNRIDKRHVLDNIWIIISMILFFLNWVEQLHKAFNFAQR